MNYLPQADIATIYCAFDEEGERNQNWRKTMKNTCISFMRDLNGIDSRGLKIEKMFFVHHQVF